MKLFEFLALAASIIMPLFNIPLIVKIVRRKSADDLSLSWLFGIWGCMLLMLPWALSTRDIVLRVFGIMNFLLFSAVVVAVLKYRNGKPE
jgi:uncharacterized protein with PQ loop repeat